MMKEIIYVHTATGYLATHFFNTQEAYFTYDYQKKEEHVNDGVDHDLSFREGLTHNTSTYTPRSLIFDYKSRFGSLAHITTSHNASEEEIQGVVDPIWSGNVVEYRQEVIPRSSYHAQLEAGDDEAENETEHRALKDDNPVHFWSDFSRVFFHPRGLLRIPDRPHWEAEASWSRGTERFNEFESEHMILDDVFRSLVEECDQLQGLQVALDSPSMASFTVKFLTNIRDDYAKLPILSFCSLSPFDPTQISSEETTASVSVLNDVMALHALASLSTQTVPLQQPLAWRSGLWSKYIAGDFTKPYHSAALLSAHIETVTLPLRLKSSLSSATDLATLCAQLNWRGDTPFSSLSGAFPLPMTPEDVPRYTYDFSHPFSLHNEGAKEEPFAQRDVFRGLKHSERVCTEKWLGKTHPYLRPPFHAICYMEEGYPIPTSYPQFFVNVDATGRRTRSLDSNRRVRSVPVYSSLQTTPRTARLARAYAGLAGFIPSRAPVVLDNLGVEKDTVKEIAEDCWRWVAAYGGEEGDDEENHDD